MKHLSRTTGVTIFAVVFGVIGITTLLLTRAATPTNYFFEPELGTGSGNISLTGTDANASGGKFALFRAPAAPSDTSAPTAPSNLAKTAQSTTTVSLSWGASTDDIGVTGYKVYRNNTAIGSPTSTSYQATGLTAGTTYSFQVSAVDASGKESTRSNTLSATTDTVVTPPPTSGDCSGALYCEDFSSGVGSFVTGLNSGQAPHYRAVGSPVASGGRLVCSNTGTNADCMFRYNKPVSGNYYVEADLILGNQNNLKAGLIANLATSSPYSWLHFHRYSYSWGRGAVLFQIANNSIAAENYASPNPGISWPSTDKLRMEVRGTQVRGFVNGTLVLTQSVNVPATQWVGLYADASPAGTWAFDNFKVGAL